MNFKTIDASLKTIQGATTATRSGKAPRTKAAASRFAIRFEAGAPTIQAWLTQLNQAHHKNLEPASIGKPGCSYGHLTWFTLPDLSLDNNKHQQQQQQQQRRQRRVVFHSADDPIEKYLYLVPVDLTYDPQPASSCQMIATIARRDHRTRLPMHGTSTTTAACRSIRIAPVRLIDHKGKQIPKADRCPERCKTFEMLTKACVKTGRARNCPKKAARLLALQNGPNSSPPEAPEAGQMPRNARAKC